MIAKATAAAATIRTANTAVNTEIAVATLRKSRSCRALTAPCRGGMVGIAGRRVDIALRLYSEAAARNPAMTIVKVTANQISSTGTVNMGGLGLGERMELLFSVPSSPFGSSPRAGSGAKN